jgi:hypothetical protein
MLGPRQDPDLHDRKGCPNSLKYIPGRVSFVIRNCIDLTRMATGLESWVSNPDETHGPLISITSWALCSVAAGFLVLRLSIRQNQGKLWLDDCVLGISWVS